MAIRLCPGRGEPCGKPVPALVGKGRPREYCGDHAPRPGGTQRRLSLAPDAPDAPPAVERPRPVPATQQPAAEVLLYPSTLARLRDAGALDHWAGQAALMMAQRIDGCDIVGSPLSAMVKAHRDSMTAALADSASEGDALDSVFSRTS